MVRVLHVLLLLILTAIFTGPGRLPLVPTPATGDTVACAEGEREVLRRQSSRPYVMRRVNTGWEQFYLDDEPLAAEAPVFLELLPPPLVATVSGGRIRDGTCERPMCRYVAARAPPRPFVRS